MEKVFFSLYGISVGITITMSFFILQIQERGNLKHKAFLREKLVKRAVNMLVFITFGTLWSYILLWLYLEIYYYI